MVKVVLLCAVGWTSGGRPVARSGSLRCVLISGAMPRLACQLVCRSGCGVCGFSTVTGHLVTPPARHRTVIPRCGMSHGSDARGVSAIF